MLRLETLVRFFSRKSIISTAYPALLILPFIALAGCTNDGAGGPTISSLSTPTDATAGLDSDRAPDSEVADSDEEKDPIIAMTSTPTGVTASLTWDRPTAINVAGYQIFYGKRSSDEPRSSEESVSNSEESISEILGSEETGSCSQGEIQAIEAPPAMITGLEPDTRYFFAIRAFSESESLCSNEITVVTPPAQS